MQIQKSFENTNVGTLYLVPTPIGNLEDMTFRAVRILKEVDFIACEDTRQTIKLCNHFEITTPMISYHEHNKYESGKHIVEKLLGGQSVALVSDAGMPAISDPGYELVLSSIREGIKVVPLPGANAALTAFIASGFETKHFYYFGFLDRQTKEKKKQLETLRHLDVPVIFYEAPHRLKETLQAIRDVLGSASIVLCRELTKKHEEFIRGTVEEVLNNYDQLMIKGEFCLIIDHFKQEENSNEQWWEGYSIKEHVAFYIEHEDCSSKDAIKRTAKDRNLPKRDVYQAYHIKES